MITSAVRLSDLATSNMDRKEKAKLIKALGIFNLGRLDLFPPPPLPAKHSRYALIGRVAAEWAQLEHLLDLIIWNLLTRLDRETASCLTAHIGGYGPKLRTIVALSKMLNLPADIEKKGVNPLVGKLAPVAEERARIVHDAWFGLPRSRHTRQFRSRSSKSAKFGLVPVKRAEMLQTIHRIVDRKQDVGRLYIKINAALEASGKRLPAPDPAFLAQSGVEDRSPATPGFRPQPSVVKRGLF